MSEHYDAARGAGFYASHLVYTDALGNERCGLTGVLIGRCECAEHMAYGYMPTGYRGIPTYDEDTDRFVIPSGQAPLAITAHAHNTN